MVRELNTATKKKKKKRGKGREGEAMQNNQKRYTSQAATHLIHNLYDVIVNEKLQYHVW